MKQSMNSGTLDNITCIFICFNNFRKNLQPKFISNNSNLNLARERESKDPNNSQAFQAFNIKNEYNENSSTFDLHSSSQNNFEEIRRKLSYYKEHSIRLKTNEFINFSDDCDFADEKNLMENKPKTSNEILKTNTRFDLINEENDIEYKPIITDTENEMVLNNNNNNIYRNINNKNNLNHNNNNNNTIEAKNLYRIASKKNINNININNQIGNLGKGGYESNLPTFKISQKLNKIPKDINLRKLSPINKVGNFNSGFNSTTNINSVNININMNNTSRNGNRFLPKITKNIGSNTLYNEKKKNNFYSNNNNNQASFRFNKPTQMHLKLNK